MDFTTLINGRRRQYGLVTRLEGAVIGTARSFARRQSAGARVQGLRPALWRFDDSTTFMNLQHIRVSCFGDSATFRYFQHLSTTFINIHQHVSTVNNGQQRSRTVNNLQQLSLTVSNGQNFHHC
jgi:hypothetical protein